MSIRNTWNDLPGWGKGAVLVGGVFALYKLGKWLFPGNDYSGGTSDKIDCGNNLSYEKNQYKVFADAIEIAIWGTSFIATWWEDDDAIAAVLLQMNTTDDVCALVRAYGTRYVGIVMKEGGNLVQMIAKYLDDDLKEAVNQYYAANGIAWIWP